LLQSLSARGVDVVGDGPGIVVLSLQNLAIANGSRERGKQALMEILKELNADAVTVQPQDLEYINGPEDFFSHAVAVGLQSDAPGLVELLHDIPIDETADGKSDGIPLFDRLAQAESFVCRDGMPMGADEAYIHRGVENDLRRSGFIDNQPYRDWLEPAPERPVPELPEEFRTSPKPYKSIFEDNF
jgi:hypothetical protein